MSDRTDRLEQAFAALDDGDPSGFRELFAPDAQWLGVPNSGIDGETPIWRNRKDVVDLLAQHHQNGHRFEPAEWFAAVLTIAAIGVTAAAAANGSVRATFTRPIPANVGSGSHVKIAWKLRDSAGHAISLKRVFVTIVCPTGIDSTTAYATSTGRGLYSANATVPPGGIGTVTIGAKGT